MAWTKDITVNIRVGENEYQEIADALQAAEFAYPEEASVPEIVRLLLAEIDHLDKHCDSLELAISQAGVEFDANGRAY